MSSAPFSLPSSPAAKCLHLVRLRELTSRSELVEATGLSQPTITRAIAALAAAGYVAERPDLARAAGRGRPTIPLELAVPQAIHAGIAVGTQSTYIALFDLKGHTLRSIDVDIPVAAMSQDDFIQHVMAALNRLNADVHRPLATVGVTTSGTVTGDGDVYAPNLGWRGVDIGAQLREQFSVPVVVTSAAAAIVGSELQSSAALDAEAVMALFADDSLGCAISTPGGVEPVAVEREDLTTEGLIDSIDKPHIRTLIDAVTDATCKELTRGALDRRARELGVLAADLAAAHSPSTIVVAGSAFIDDPLAPGPFARAVRASGAAGSSVELRMIPTHREVVRDIARAVALDLVLREPLAVAAP
ncbi:ROK family protein [Corynebacterium liangguodongii]|uniref:Crp/Fnr family transcriptional regulator n=1 Tax=Corynebacterium liangguodongii TaxID=2079535 RepID=A0A2S0WBS8_9CORY|nr:ROK family protein [Corynebacterium liangguodongii]AWB83132.1 Crp/Fnr family transcriptional regulator [Corynebacterium liangguodongii]PWB99267.1 ROK family protein [Corynebacterium liangguodongii]